MSQILRRYEQLAEQIRDSQKLARILLETGASVDEVGQTAGVTAGGDGDRLRGLPAIGRGVSGAVRGSNPVAALEAKESRRRR